MKWSEREIDKYNRVITHTKGNSNDVNLFGSHQMKKYFLKNDCLEKRVLTRNNFNVESTEHHVKICPQRVFLFKYFS